MFYLYQYLEHVNDNVEGGIGDEHDVVPAGESFGPRRPLDDVPVLNHLREIFPPH